MNYIKKSIKIIKSTQLKNGGILATLPKGGYPYVYTRDGVIATKALNVTGNWKNSEKFYYFMKKFTKIKQYGEVFQRYNVNGWPAVSRKNQNDNEGLLLHGIYHTYQHNKNQEFLEDMWQMIQNTVKLLFSYSKSGLIHTQRSIHEFYRLEHGYEIWSNSAAVRGLKDASQIAKILNHKKESEKWDEKANIILKNIKRKMFNKKLGIYIKNTRYPKISDMSQLAPFYFEIDNSKKILRNTMNHLRKNLWENKLGGFRRFKKFDICNDWHWYTGGSGSWCFLTAWAARFYKKLGDKKNYQLCSSWLDKVIKTGKGNLPEHIATIEEYNEWKKNEIEFNNRIINETKIAEDNIKKFKEHSIVYWANPLCWSHAEYVLLHKEK